MILGHHTAPVERAARRHRQRRRGQRSRAGRLAEHQKPRRVQAALVESANARAERRRPRTRHERRLDRLPVGGRHIGNEGQVQLGVTHDIVGAGPIPRRGKNIVFEDDGVIGRVVVGHQRRAIPDDVARHVGPGTVARVGQRHAVIGEIEGRDVRGQAASALLVHVDQRVVEEDEASGSRRPAPLVETGVVDVIEEVIDNRPLGKLIGEIDATRDGARGVAHVVSPVGVAVRVQEDVPFDPRVGAVEVQMVVAGPVEHIIEDLQNGAGPLAPGEVDGVVESVGMADVIVA